MKRIFLAILLPFVASAKFDLSSIDIEAIKSTAKTTLNKASENKDVVIVATAVTAVLAYVIYDAIYSTKDSSAKTALELPKKPLMSNLDGTYSKFEFKKDEECYSPDLGYCMNCDDWFSMNGGHKHA